MVTQAAAELEGVFRAHQACVLKAAYRVTGSMADAEESRNPSSYDWPVGLSITTVSSNLQSYLHRSAVNASPRPDSIERAPRGRPSRSGRRSAIQSQLVSGTRAFLDGNQELASSRTRQAQSPALAEMFNPALYRRSG